MPIGNVFYLVRLTNLLICDSDVVVRLGEIKHVIVLLVNVLLDAEAQVEEFERLVVVLHLQIVGGMVVVGVGYGDFIK